MMRIPSICYMLPLLLFLTARLVGSAIDSSPRCALEKILRSGGLVDVREIDSTIAVDLKYASPDNFMKTDVYGGLRRCFLQRAAAKKLAKASAFLKKRRPDYRLVVVDGARPRQVQWTMWNLVEKTPQRNYVADPRRGSMHNYGCAVDVTIADTSGRRLDMGTPMDHFGALAEPRLESVFIKNGALTREHAENRRLLREVMIAAGFIPLPIEWWHFDAFDTTTVRGRFAIIE